MTPTKDKRTFRFVVFFTAVILFVNLLIAILYFPFAYFKNTGSVFLIPFHYFERLLDLVFSVFSIAVILTVLRLESKHCAVIIHVIPIVGNLVFQGLCLLFQSIYPTYDSHLHQWRDLLLSLLFNFSVFLISHVLLTVILHFTLLRGAEDAPAGRFSFANPLCLSNLITVIIFFTAGLVMQVLDTVSFIDEHFGILSFLRADEIALIVWDYLFLVITSVLAFFVMQWTEKHADRYLNRDA